MTIQVIAVDWSGALRTGRKIWLAVARERRLVSLDNHRNREKTIDHVLDLVASEPRSVVGLDFAFSFPEWFVHREGGSAREFWVRAGEMGETWIRRLSPPFFTKGGWSGQTYCQQACMRQTEKETCGHPESVFKMVGSKQVGRGSIRGIPHLRPLEQAGCKIWPFDQAELRGGFPLVVEIYPRALYGDKVTKSNEESRSEYLKGFPGLDPDLRKTAASSDDAFDAATSALIMDRHRESFMDLPRDGPPYSLEGRIWTPAGRNRSKPGYHPAP